MESKGDQIIKTTAYIYWGARNVEMASTLSAGCSNFDLEGGAF